MDVVRDYDSDEEEQFHPCERDWKTLQSLHHRSILPIYGVYRGRRRGSVYMVTELYETTLEELLSLKYPLSLEATKCILYELLDVLESVHAQGLLHSDLKPGNVLYRGGGIAVCDWGSATRVGQKGTVPTLGYCSPEMVLWCETVSETVSKTVWSTGVDVWSWGVMVVELLSGRFLHEGESELAAVNQMVRLAGTMGLNKEEREWFDGLCSHNHIHFPDMEDSIAVLVRERIPETDSREEVETMLRGCFQLVPWRRMSAKELKESGWWEGREEVEQLPEVGEWVRERHEEKRRKMMEMMKQLQGLFC
ncbi:cyclin-dependent kinase [Blastocystis sp. ATCC 50177/Nand II]|uniref:Cyclin-dependent kinase n=1 Tax=Blastocystis sp. subtype 1 (strain ATCC 50177 / NandII) TaxID=478820 RepID=A0A196S4U1_BLAHN|nr:cyclin-dependent kinase [Blastocystis sp. ATCC 50177/Nand II]